MQTHLDCIPCFFRQIVDVSRAMNLGSEETKKIIDKVALALPDFKLSLSPPEMAGTIHRLIRDTSGIKDPYLCLKQKSNNLVMDLYPELKKMIFESKDSMLQAVKFAIAGNIIDYGAVSDLEAEREIPSLLNKINNETSIYKEAFFHYYEFLKKLSCSQSLLYLGDNSGEIVFDRLLIEEIKEQFPGLKIFYAVKESPVLNDSLREDAEFCGLDKLVTVVSNGTNYPGTLLNECSREFLNLWKASDMIISKGQGNFESLSEYRGKDIFFMFIAKCPVVCKELACELKDMILL